MMMLMVMLKKVRMMKRRMIMKQNKEMAMIRTRMRMILT